MKKLAFAILVAAASLHAEPIYWVLTGNYTYQIPTTVTGTTNQSVTCSLLSGPGSVTSGCLYSVPQGVLREIGGYGQWEQGNRVRFDSNGYVRGVRFLKVAPMSGTHIGSFWSSTGTLLGQATFTETASGWQDVQFGSPVAVTANTTYVVSFHENDQNWVDSYGYLTAMGVDNAPVHILADNISGSASVCASGSTPAFPTTCQANDGRSFFVDVDFSTTSSGGTVTNAYTSTPVVGQQAFIKVTSVADSNATTTFAINLLMRGTHFVNENQSTPSTTLYDLKIDSGVPYGFPTDSNGNVWNPEGGLEQTSPGSEPSDFGPPGCQNNNPWCDPELPIYETSEYGNGPSTNDMIYSFIVPNGQYRIKAMYYALNGGYAPGGQTLTMQPYVSSGAWGQTRFMVESQHNIIWHNYDYLMGGPYANNGYAESGRLPAYAYLPATVTNNTLEFNQRRVFSDLDTLNGAGHSCLYCGYTAVAGLKIEPDSTPAHWAIDAQQKTTVSPGVTTWALQTVTAGQSFELGELFIPSSNVYITGARFYKNVLDTGTHTASLWSVNGCGGCAGGDFDYTTGMSGTLLATATFTGETASGWQSVNFTSPVALTAGLQYVISYHTTSGYLYYTAKPLLTPTQNFSDGVLTAYAGGYHTGTTAFPGDTTTLQGFAVDPIYSLNSGGTSPTTLFKNYSALPGQQVNLYLQDWYTGLSDVQWSILSGPGTITTGTDLYGLPCAFYTAPNTQPAAGSAAVIQAQSISTPSVKATIPLYFTGTSFAAH